MRGSVQLFFPVAKPTKFSTAMGADSGRSRKTISPLSVTSVAVIPDAVRVASATPGRPWTSAFDDASLAVSAHPSEAARTAARAARLMSCTA